MDGVPVYDAPERGYEKALHDGVVHVRGTGFPWQDVANVYIAGHRVGYPGTRSNLVFWDLDKLRKGMRSSSRTPTERVTPTRYSRSV